MGFLLVLVLGIGIVKGHPKVLVLGIVKGHPKVLGIGIGFEFLLLSISAAKQKYKIYYYITRCLNVCRSDKDEYCEEQLEDESIRNLDVETGIHSSLPPAQNDDAEISTQHISGSDSCWQHIKSTLGHVLAGLTCGFGPKLAFILVKEFVFGLLLNGVDVVTDVNAAVNHFR